MGIVFDPEYAWQRWAAAAAMILATLILAKAWTVPGRIASTISNRAGVTALSLLGAALFAIALCGPSLTQNRANRGLHVPVLVDVSDSMLRVTGGWPELRRSIVNRLRRSFDDPALRTATGKIMTFRSAVSAFGNPVPLQSVGSDAARIVESNFAVGAGTNIAAALQAAGDDIEHSQGRGAVVLLTDGNQTEGDALESARRLAGKGIPVYVLPMAGDAPELAIVSANLPPSVEAGAETFARGVLRNDGLKPVHGQLDLFRNALRFPASDVNSAEDGPQVPVQFASRVSGRFRMPVSFAEPGLQYVDLKLSGPQGAHARRLFTYVESPPRVLSLGDDLWRRAFAPGALSIVTKDPRTLTAADVAEPYDGIVIDSVPATAFNSGVLSKLSEAVTSKGTGLFLMNGRHLGTGKDPTNVKSYNDTPVEKLAPLVARPRPKESEASRQIFMLIDGSGSMGGWPLQEAQQIASYAVDKLLTSKDRLDVLAFTTECRILVSDLEMTPANRDRATEAIRSIEAGGGTDPVDCLHLLSGRKVQSCGLFFLSDGYFANGIAGARPDCRAAVFGIGRDSFPAGDPLRELADPIPVPNASFDPANIKIPFFQKRDEDHFYEFGPYKPMSMKTVLPRAGETPIPGIELDGSATTYPKDTADLVAMRPKLTDPVLAFLDNGAGNVGEFTGSLNEQWVTNEDGRRAIQDWVSEILPIRDRRRYSFQLSQRGQELVIDLTLTPRGGKLPAVDHVDASFEAPGAPTIDLALRPDQAVPDVFHGRIDLGLVSRPLQGRLALRESGPDALPRPQRISMMLPPKGDIAGPLSVEAMSYGLNEDLLRRIAGVGGGGYDSVESLGRQARAENAGQLQPIWQIFVASGCAACLGAVLWRRLALS